MKKRIQVPNKIRAELQKEINSTCPFCKSREVGHFEVHHIDEDPSNNLISNLLLICPLCHSKITKQDISVAEVIQIKEKVSQQLFSDIEFVGLDINTKECGWEPTEDIPYAFHLEKVKSYNPIFNFTFINHTKKTIVLTDISTKTKKLPIGLAGPYIPLPSVIRPIIKHKIELRPNNEWVKSRLLEKIEIPTGRAFQFQVEFYSDENSLFHPMTPLVLNLHFWFNEDKNIEIPKILLNTTKDYDSLSYAVIT